MKNISKGQKLSLEKELSFKNLNIGFKWDQSNASGYDIDLSILMIGNSGKLEKEENFVFYNNLSDPSRSVKILESAKSGYKKTAEVNLSSIPSDVVRLIFILTIDNGEQNNQRFGNVKDIFADINDSSNNVHLSYKIEGLTQETAIITIEIYNHNGEWKLQSTGNGFNSGLEAILKQYGDDSVQVDNSTSTPTPPIPPSNNYSGNSGSSSGGYNPPSSGNRPSNQMPVGKPSFVQLYKQRLEALKSPLAVSGLQGKTFKFVFALDMSFHNALPLKNGSVQEFIERTLPMSAYFNDRVSIDLFLFNEQALNHNNEYSLQNAENFLNKEIMFKYHLSESYYAPVMQKILNKYSNAGKNSEPVVVFFITAGDCEDARAAENEVVNASSKGVFWQFVGLGGDKTKYSFLNKLDKLQGRRVDNASFVHFSDIESTKNEEFYNTMFLELPKWFNSAKSVGII